LEFSQSAAGGNLVLVSLPSIDVKHQRRSFMFKKTLVIASIITPIVVASAIAQQAGIKRTPIRTIEFPPGYTTVTAIAELAPGSCAGRHTHPGIESGYVMEGDLVLKIDGKLDQTLKAGGSFESPPFTPHDACTVSGFKVLATYVVERGKPLASPAP
jgi:quercetin dioxygenase-like cupin family protein